MAVQGELLFEVWLEGLLLGGAQACGRDIKTKF